MWGAYPVGGAKQDHRSDTLRCVKAYTAALG